MKIFKNAIFFVLNVSRGKILYEILTWASFDQENSKILPKNAHLRHFLAKSPIFKGDFEGVRVEIDPQKMKPQNRFSTRRINFRGQIFEIPKIDFLKIIDGGILKYPPLILSILIR